MRKNHENGRSKIIGCGERTGVIRRKVLDLPPPLIAPGPGVNGIVRVLLAPLRGTFARSVAILSSAALIQNALVLATSPILSRLFSPEEFGVAGLLYAFAAIPTVASTGHYFLAIMQTRKRVESVNIIVLSWLIVLSMSFLASVIVTIIYYGPDILGGFGGQLGGNIFFIPAFMLLEACRTVGRIWEVRHADYRSLFRNRMIETIGMIISQITAGLAGIGAIGLIGGRLLGVTASAFDLFYTFARDIGGSGRKSVRLGKLKQVARRHWRFPAYQTPAELLGCFCRQMPPILLANYFSVEAVGLYWIANRLLERPTQLFGADMNRVFVQRVAEERNRARDPTGLFVKTTLVMAALSLPPFLLVIAFGPELFSLLFGGRWHQAGEYGRWMSLFSFATLCALPARSMATVYGLQRVYVIVESVRALLGAAFMAAAAELTNDDVTAMAAFSVLQLAVIAIFVLVAPILVRKRMLLENTPA
jgi:O-antigen/teichoic acid export membrane protein